MGIRVALTLSALSLIAAAPPKLDPDTRAWWATTAELSNDSMEGRDTGSAAYERAARLVARKFAAAGLKPAGENGGWFQRVPMHEIALTSVQISVGGRPLRFLYDLTVGVGPGMPQRVNAELVYAGYCGTDQLAGVRGKIVICHGTHREGLPDAAAREAAVRAAGAVGIMTIADPGFIVEPPRWPFAYARSVTLADDPAQPDAFLKFTLNAASLSKVVGPKAIQLIAAGSAGKSLPTFAVSGQFRAQFATRERDIASSNVLAMLPGRDPAAANQAIALTAHLDGYGFGTPVNGDRLYNGTLDDAAYVALLIRLAERRRAQAYRRPLLFTVVSGEEKGLLGSRWFVKHPTAPLSGIAADINLDQLRPIFPLEILTVHALDDSTLGDDVRAVAGGLGIAVRHDPEPERNLLRRSDNWPFMQAGIPATGFVFGYRPGSRSEQIYRQWYRTGYHKPQDDLNQPMDWKAAEDFNRFFYALVERVADQPTAPAWKSTSKFRPSR
ncbi:M28 family peptidase [Sphingomonas flavescens]|uniref:M28 family peptidase n=1 Tax=Sphingomonas flavescens TaxID=3132797 RepID=UPI0028055EA6|nr:M28 family peptidase [Sphingomonas limnosediminicola]